MANDAQQAARHLAGMPSVAELKDQMVRQILGDLAIPTKLQFALSQRLYYEALAEGGLFWASNDPVAHWMAIRPTTRRQVPAALGGLRQPGEPADDLPDGGRGHRRPGAAQGPAPLARGAAPSDRAVGGGAEAADHRAGLRPRFRRPAPEAAAALPCRADVFRRLHAADRPAARGAGRRRCRGDGRTGRWPGPSRRWKASGSRRRSPAGSAASSGEIFALDPFSGRGVDTGATRTERAIILPARPYQVLAERNPPGFHDVRKFVVAAGRVLSYR